MTRPKEVAFEPLAKNLSKKNPTYSANFSSLSDENKEWILEYLSTGKGVIPYEKIKPHEDLNCVPEGEFFSKSEFYSLFKNEIISDQDYEKCEKILATLTSHKAIKPK